MGAIKSILTLLFLTQSLSVESYRFYNRAAWKAKKASYVRPLKIPVPYVIIHHTYMPSACYSFNDCSSKMRGMQDYHMSLGWGDIGYNFCLGDEGSAYEGRGWRIMGIHSGNYNGISVGICFIGDWRSKLPTRETLNTAKALIADGVRMGFIRHDYKLIGHLQIMQTACPGQALEKQISTWPHFHPGHLNTTPSGEKIVQVNRDQWDAREPKTEINLKTPAPYVIIHHSLIPPVCHTREECLYAMKTMQSLHMDEKDWNDIAYNFVIGGDGDVYVGRGWVTQGAHTLNFNNMSVGICFVGNYNDEVPSTKMIQTTKSLIADGVHRGYLDSGYKLIGHRQVVTTVCPGDALFNEIKTWPHYDPTEFSATKNAE